MWSVVCFSEDNSVAAVLKFWYQDGYCAWPNKFVHKYIECRVNPNELEFAHFKSIVLHTNIGNNLLLLLLICNINIKYYYELTFNCVFYR